MTDGVIKGTGNSRWLKAPANVLTLYPTYDDLMIALAAGTFPIDLYRLNTIGWEYLGDLINKNTLLKDTTAQAAGLTAAATPDDVFKWLIAESKKIVPVSKGGTGNTTGNAVSATKLQTGRTILTDLGSSSAASFNGTANISPGVSGILPVSKGGTGATTLATLATSLIPHLSAASIAYGTGSGRTGITVTLPFIPRFGVCVASGRSSSYSYLTIVVNGLGFSVAFHSSTTNYEVETYTVAESDQIDFRYANTASNGPNVTGYYAAFG